MAKKGILTAADYLTVEEFNGFMDNLRSDKEYTWELFCRIAFCCALRCSDVLRLQWSEVLDKDEIMVVERKTQKSRKIPVNKTVKIKIRELYVLLGGPVLSRPIIYNPRTKRKYTIQTVNEKLKYFRCRYRMKINRFSTHTFRKTFGRMVYEKSGKSGESLVLLSRIFRHSSIEITMVYIGITQDEIDGVFSLIKF